MNNSIVALTTMAVTWLGDCFLNSGFSLILGDIANTHAVFTKVVGDSIMVNELVTSKIYLFIGNSVEETSAIFTNLANYNGGADLGLSGNYAIVISNGTAIMLEFYNMRIFFDGPYGNLYPIEVTSSDYPLVEGTGSFQLGPHTYPVWSLNSSEEWAQVQEISELLTEIVPHLINGVL